LIRIEDHQLKGVSNPSVPSGQLSSTCEHNSLMPQLLQQYIAHCRKWENWPTVYWLKIRTVEYM